MNPPPPPAVDEAVLALAGETVSLLSERPPGTALARLGRLLDAQLATAHREVFELCSLATLETWLTGHGALILGHDGDALLDARANAIDEDLDPSPQPTARTTAAELAAALDLAMYGVSDPPKAFQRHLRSFFDEIDVSGGLGTVRLLDAAPVDDRQPDHVRVCLWVTLFLAHDHYAACERPADAAAARSLFDRFRSATDRWYAERRRTLSDG